MISNAALPTCLKFLLFTYDYSVKNFLKFITYD
jgi:hypothetical protein